MVMGKGNEHPPSSTEILSVRIWLDVRDTTTSVTACNC